MSKEKKNTNTTFSINGDVLVKVDALQKRMSEKINCQVTRTAVVKRLIEEGLKVIKV